MLRMPTENYENTFSDLPPARAFYRESLILRNARSLARSRAVTRI